MEIKILETITNEFLPEAASKVNPLIVFILLLVGATIKHFKMFEKVQNDLIPGVLTVLSFIITFVQYGFSVDSVVVALLTTVVSIGIHQESKNLLLPIINKVKDGVLKIRDTIFKLFKIKIEDKPKE